jgi:protein ImuB
MRRVVAIVLPQIACEIARAKRPTPPRGVAVTTPIGVILERSSAASEALDDAPKATAVLDAVSDDARRYGVRAGQQVTEAAALLASLVVQRVTHDELDAALGRVAEVALAFGPTAAIRLREEKGAGRVDEPRTPWGDAPFDTVWLDVTGSAHLVGGEEALLAELEERVVALGHRARVAIAGGPRIAQALARYEGGRSGLRVTRSAPSALANSGGERDDARALSGLPVQALALDPETVGFLLRIGVITVGDLMQLPRARVAARLGPRAGAVLALASGHDDTPLPPFTPPREIAEAASFEDGVETTDALIFVLRGMASHAAARLGARGEACTLIEVEIPLDRSIARLRGADQDQVGFTIELPAPLASEADLLRALRARLDRTELIAPAVGVRLRVAQIVPAPQVQLDLSRASAADPDSLPALLAELSAEIGADRVGLLATSDAHRPEAASQLTPVTLGPTSAAGARAGVRRRRAQLSLPGLAEPRPDPLPPPTRLLPTPIPLGRVRRGSVVSVPHLFAVDELSPLLRLEGVEWWTKTPASRDYLRAHLSSGGSGGDRAGKGARAASATALVYVVRRTGEMFLQGWYE